MITDITSTDHFNQIVGQTGVTVVDYHAGWSGPCKAMLPKFSQLSELYRNVKFCKIDVDEHAQLSQQAGARVYPTFILYRGGTPIKVMSGANPEGLVTLIKDAL